MSTLLHTHPLKHGKVAHVHACQQLTLLIHLSIFFGQVSLLRMRRTRRRRRRTTMRMQMLRRRKRRRTMALRPTRATSWWRLMRMAMA